MGRKKTRFKPPYIVDIWQERDRASITVVDSKGQSVAEWWDDVIAEMIEDGFFDNRNLGESVISYLVDVGTIKAETTVMNGKKYTILPDFEVT